MECFARFFAGILVLDDIGLDELIAKAVLRICIALVSARKKLDKLFVKRSFIGDHDQDDQVTSLKIFLLKWIENFNEEFTENFMLKKSVLKLNEKKVKEKLVKKGLKVSSYLSKVLESSNSQQNLEEKSAVPLLKGLDKIDEDSLQSSDNSVKEGQQSNKKKSRVQFEETKKPNYEKIESGYEKDSRLHLQLESHDHSASTRLSEQNSRGKETGNLITPLPRVTQRNFTVPKMFGGSETMPNRYSKGLLSFKDALIPMPNINKINRKSLLKVNNEEIQENVSQLTKKNIKKHYDNFFGNNTDGSKVSIKEESLENLESLDSRKEISIVGKIRVDTLKMIFDKVEKMSEDKQDLLFQKLLEIQVKRNAETKP